MIAAPVVVLACDKFKGSLTAAEVTEHLAAGIRQVLPSAEIRRIPVADGGDGTLAALATAGFELVPITVRGPTGDPVAAHYAINGETALVELADTCGLQRLPKGRRQPLTASSRGLGEAVTAALDAGARTIVLGIGGSASTDGGAGLLRALGAHLYDADGIELADGGGALHRLARLDISTVDTRLRDVELILATDVDNLLLGTRGTVPVFAAQKGATPADRRMLELGLHRFARLVTRITGRNAAVLPGTGAGGGVGFAAVAVLGARVEPGVEFLLDRVGFGESLRGADLVVTGEGSFDRQTLGGKAPLGVLRAARRSSVPAVVVCGRTDLDARTAERLGARRVYALTDLEPDVGQCLQDAVELLRRTAVGLAGDWLRTECTGDRP